MVLRAQDLLGLRGFEVRLETGSILEPSGLQNPFHFVTALLDALISSSSSKDYVSLNVICRRRCRSQTNKEKLLYGQNKTFSGFSPSAFCLLSSSFARFRIRSPACVKIRLYPLIYEVTTMGKSIIKWRKSHQVVVKVCIAHFFPFRLSI